MRRSTATDASQSGHATPLGMGLLKMLIWYYEGVAKKLLRGFSYGYRRLYTRTVSQRLRSLIRFNTSVNSQTHAQGSGDVAERVITRRTALVSATCF